MFVMWFIKKKKSEKNNKKPKASEGIQIEGMENDPLDNGVPNVIYDLEAIEKETKQWKENSED